MPDRGQPFLGTSGRARARALERRRRVLAVLLEALGLTFLIGLVPPLRAMWSVSAVVAGFLLVYVWMLLRLRSGRAAVRSGPVSERPAVGAPAAQAVAPLMAAMTTPEYPVVETADGRRVVVISDSARRRANVAG